MMRNYMKCKEGDVRGAATAAFNRVHPVKSPHRQWV